MKGGTEVIGKWSKLKSGIEVNGTDEIDIKGRKIKVRDVKGREKQEEM